jgi:hypothetical protein
MEFKFDRTVVKKFKLGNEPKDYEFWLRQPPEKRIEAMELLRREYYGEDAFKSGFQRVHRIIKQA